MIQNINTNKKLNDKRKNEKLKQDRNLYKNNNKE